MGDINSRDRGKIFLKIGWNGWLVWGELMCGWQMWGLVWGNVMKG